MLEAATESPLVPHSRRVEPTAGAVASSRRPAVPPGCGFDWKPCARPSARTATVWRRAALQGAAEAK
eukprot:4913719-Prymnesium_polylepis.1